MRKSTGFRFIQAICALGVIASPLYAQDALSQDELAAKIFELSHSVDDRADHTAGYFLADLVSESSVTIDDCTATIRIYAYAEGFGNFLTFEGSFDIQFTDLQRSVDGELYEYYSNEDTDRPPLNIDWPPFKPGPTGAVAFGVRGDGTFLGKARPTIIFSDTPVPIYETPMEELHLNRFLYEVYNLENEDQIRNLVAAYQEYQRRFCTLGS